MQAAEHQFHTCPKEKNRLVVGSWPIHPKHKGVQPKYRLKFTCNSGDQRHYHWGLFIHFEYGRLIFFITLDAINCTSGSSNFSAILRQILQIANHLVGVFTFFFNDGQNSFQAFLQRGKKRQKKIPCCQNMGCSSLGMTARSMHITLLAVLHGLSNGLSGC